MRLMFQVGSRTIVGSLGGRFLHCTMRPAQGGALPPAGDYAILPPVSDPIYGRLALMAPVGGSGAVDVRWKLVVNPSAVSGKLVDKPLTTAVSGKVFEKPDARRTAIGQKLFEKPIDFQKADPIHSAGGGQVFVLSDRPVLGRNCIVVSSGFADLMDGLQKAGGARVTVA
jgi:hypothetical protein